MEGDFKNEVQKLCDMQIALWNDMKNELETMENSTYKEICEIFYKHLREVHHDAVLQLVKVKVAIDNIAKVYE